MLSDPLHDTRPTGAAWTTINAEEALPGVATPLSAEWMRIGMAGTRRGFADIGAISVKEAEAEAGMDAQVGTFFYGRFAFNVDFLRRIGDQMPGSSGDAVEEKLLGRVRPGVPSQRQAARLPVIIAKFPLGVLNARRVLPDLEHRVDSWWRDSVVKDSTSTLDDAVAAFREAERAWLTVVRRHAVINMVATGAFELLQQTCREAAMPGLEYRLVTSDEDVYEAQVIADLWRVAHGRLSEAEFLAGHGYHGPVESELSSASWREDAGPLQPIIRRLAKGEQAPLALHGRRAAERRAAEAQILAGSSGPARLKIQGVLRFARVFVPLKEISRSTFLKTYDVARCMARRIGEHLVEDGVLDTADDVFYLTPRELRGPYHGELRKEVLQRRQRRQEYARLELPDRWEANPTPIPLKTEAPTAQADGLSEGPVTGLGVSAGVVEGRALVVEDASTLEEIGDNDILVCHTTDPSWASLMFAVAGCVIDVGSSMSHGAIVAREIGIPCVINTRVGTKVLRTGDRIKVDGDTGTVTRA